MCIQLPIRVAAGNGAIGPADDTVITVTVESPKDCCSGPRSVSTVWMRDSGATRHSCQTQPDLA